MLTLLVTGANALGRRAVLKERLQDKITHDRLAEAAGHLWALCTESYIDAEHADTIRYKSGLVRRLCELVRRGAETPNHTITEPACAALHTLCTEPRTLALAPNAVPALVMLIANGSADAETEEPTTERLTEDAIGLIHKLAHGDPGGLCRSEMLAQGIVPVLLRLLAQTPSWFLDGGKLGQELFAEGAGKMNTGAANERVVEEALGTLRNLTEVKAGRAAMMTEVNEAVEIFLRLIEDRGEFTKQIGFASHTQKHGFSGYTFERVQQACLGAFSHHVCFILLLCEVIRLIVLLLCRDHAQSPRRPEARRSNARGAAPHNGCPNTQRTAGAREQRQRP